MTRGGVKCRSLALAITFVFHASATAQDKALTFRIAASYPQSNTVMSAAQQQLVSHIKTLSAGTIAAQLLAPGELVGSDKLLNAVGNGSVQAAFVDPAAWVAKDPAFYLFSGIPNGAAAMQMLAWVISPPGKRLLQQLHTSHNVEALTCGGFVPASGVWFRKPIKDLGGFKDLNVVATGISAQLVAGLGAKLQSVRRDELQRALQSKQIDAVTLPGLSLQAQIELLGKAAPYYYPAGLGERLSLRSLIVSRNIWETMSKAQRAIVQSSCDTLSLTLLSRSASAAAQTVATLKAHRINAYPWSGADKEALAAAWSKLAMANSEQSVLFKTGWQALRKFLAGGKAYEAMAR